MGHDLKACAIIQICMQDSLSSALDDEKFNHTQPCGCIDEMNLTLRIILQAVAKQAFPLDPVGGRGKLDLFHPAESVGQALDKYVI